MAASKRTKKLRRGVWVTNILSILLSFGPLISYIILAFKNSQSSTTDKCILLSMLSVGVILSGMAVFLKYIPKCSIWLIIIGLYLCLDNIIGTILVIAITQVIDEIIVVPVNRVYKNKLETNKEIDRALSDRALL